MDYPTFNQRHYPEELGVGVGYSIADYGCALVSLTTICNHFGKEVNPATLNQSLIQVNGYVDNGAGAKTLMVWGAITQIFPDVQLSYVKKFANVPADMGLIDETLAKKTPVIVGVDWYKRPAQQVPTHFIVIYEKLADGTYMCMDPWYGDRVSFNARYCINGMGPKEAILQVVAYSFTGVATPQIHDMNLAIEDMRRARDENYALFQAETLKNAELMKQLTAVRSEYEAKLSEARSRADVAEKQAVTVTEENTGLKKQIEQVNIQNSSLAQLYKDKCDEDSTAIDEGMKAQEKLKNYQEFVKNTAGLLDVTVDPTKPEFDKLIVEINGLLKVKRDTIKNLVNPIEEFFTRLGFSFKK